LIVNAFLKTTLLLVAAVIAGSAIQAQPGKVQAGKIQPAKPVPARSAFSMPTNPREGRDPFFPESTRPYEEAMPQTNNPASQAKTLVIRGSSGVGDHAMLIINNHTFALGDEGDVSTAGGRVHLRLVEIRKDVAVVEVNGTRHELSLTHK
jgi:hypothetical protein